MRRGHLLRAKYREPRGVCDAMRLAVIVLLDS